MKFRAKHQLYCSFCGKKLDDYHEKFCNLECRSKQQAKCMLGTKYFLPRNSKKLKFITKKISKKSSIFMKKLWKDPTYKVNQVKKATGNKNALGYRHTEKAKKSMRGPRKGFKPWNTGKTKYTDDRLKVIGEKNRDYRKGKPNWRRGITNIEFYGKTRAKQLEKLNRSQTLQKIKEGKFPQTNTLPHRLIRDAMDKENMTGWVDEYPVKYFSIDRANPDKKIAIYIDGDYWHANPKFYKSTDIVKGGLTASKIWKRDKSHTSFLTNRGWKVLRFWESDIKNNISKCLKCILDIYSGGAKHEI